MRDKKKQVLWRSLEIFAASFITVAIIGLLVFVTQGREIPVLNPQGFIANQQYSLIMITVILGIFVVVPVFILLFSIAWKYRIGNKKAKYNPELEGNRNLEILWWSIPCLIILVLAIITYFSTHALDPYKQLDSQKTPVEVQVVAFCI
jgi:cytochrome o ubiquinol oxidase subunit 2